MSIDASQLVSITDRTIDGGGTGLEFNGLILTQTNEIPAGGVVSYPDAASVGDAFGLQSLEYDLAQRYFTGFVNSNRKPRTLLFGRYVDADVPGWLQGAPVTATLEQIQAVNSGDLTVSIDGQLQTLSGLDFSQVTSFSQAAQVLQTALTPAATPATAGRLTGAPITTALDDLKAVTAGKLDISVDGTAHSLADLNFSSAADLADVAGVLGAALTAWASVTLSGTALTVTSNTTGASSSVSFAANPASRAKAAPADLAGALGLTQAAGAAVTPGADAVTPPAPTVTFSSLGNVYRITSGTTGADSSVSYATPPAGGSADAATLLGLTEAAGAIVSPGMAARSEAENLEAVVKATRNWVTFMTAWEPELESKLAFARWCNGYAPRYLYAAWDTDIKATQQLATGTFAEQVTELGYAGTAPVYGQARHAQFVLAAAASIDFDETNGRITFAYKAQDGLEATCDDGTIAQTLIAKGYNFYGDYATANDEFRFFQRGVCSGSAAWIDTYIDKIALNNDLQLALVNLFANAKSLPYNRDGYAQIEAAALDPINKYLNFGAIRQGITLSSA
ncbi:MAG: DUF3383 family protein [Christensenellaceae bacterium]|nr:DUF3383 family protein [Christensenellaceae bacterium]